MKETTSKIISMSDGLSNLRVYTASLTSMKLIFSLCSQKVLQNEFDLTRQLKRASLSVIANIAEGYGRNSQRDFGHFLSISLGSANEVIAFLDAIGALYDLPIEEEKYAYESICKQLFVLRKKIISNTNSKTNTN